MIHYKRTPNALLTTGTPLDEYTTQENAEELIAEHNKKHEEQSKKQLTLTFVKAHRELLKQGRVPDHVAHHRIAVCTGITVEGRKVSAACPAYKHEDKGWGTGHCKACGCPDWKISEMHRPERIVEPGKAWFPMGCPIDKFSAAPGRRVDAEANKEQRQTSPTLIDSRPRSCTKNL